MITVYQHDASGYFLYPFEYPGGPMPANCVAEAPEKKTGNIPRWMGTVWEYVENHKGEEGYVNGSPFTITEYGPYPEGWSTTPPPPTLEEQQAAFTNVLQQRMDDFARTRNYDNALSCASYATSSNPKFAAEGQYIVKARDATWAKGYQIFDEVMSGERPMPTVEEVVSELPPLEWPEI